MRARCVRACARVCVRARAAWEHESHAAARVAKCELGYRGADCSQKECPSGNDPQLGPGLTAFDTQGTTHSVEYRDCSGRGLCDYSAGLCACFHGFYGEDCSLQSALV